jgi:hypothetical protein
MTNGILHVEVRDQALVPAMTELHIQVVPRFRDARTELRGRLMGPRCRFASTVEVAYPLRPLSRPAEEPGLLARVIIPEASFWEPASPHLYAGPVELWQDGQRSEVIQVQHGLRSLAISPRGLRLNGAPIQLHGREVTALDETSALALREAGYNLVVVSLNTATHLVWEMADRIGLFVLGRLAGPTAPPDQLAGHPSCLGWLIEGQRGRLVDGTPFEVVPQGQPCPPDQAVLRIDVPPSSVR